MCSNYRGVTLLSHCGKIYTRIIEKRLRQRVENIVLEGQYGFRPGRSTTDLIFAIRMLLEKRWEWDRMRYILFIDMEKAFDRVQRNGLWKIVKEEHYAIPKKLIRTIKSLYAKFLGRVKAHNAESDWFDIQTGVRQGDVLSPILFIVFMDKCMRDIGIGGLGKKH